MTPGSPAPVETGADPRWNSRFWGSSKDADALRAVPTVRVLEQACPDAVLSAEDQAGDLSLRVRAEDLHKVATQLREHPDLRYDMLIDVAGLDRSTLPQGDGGERFHARYHFYSMPHGKRLRLHVPLDAEKPEVDSLTSLYDSANCSERESYDMYGFHLRGHP